MVTTPRNLWSPDDPDDYNLVVDLATMQRSVNDALDDIVENNPPAYFAGPDANRIALAAPAKREGVTWRATDTRVGWRVVGGVWKPVPELWNFQTVIPANHVLTTTMTAIAGLTITDAPVGVPCLLTLQVQANNGGSGGPRFITIRASNGTTLLDTERIFSLPLQTNTGNAYTIVYTILVTPTSPTFTLSARADQNSSVILSQGALRLEVAP